MALVDDLRGLVAAGTAEYTDGAGTAYWTSSQLTAALANRRWLTFEEPITYYANTGTSGTAQYLRARVDAPGRFESGTAGVGGTIIDSLGATVSGYTLDTDGWLLFTADQRGSVRYLTAWSYDVYAAAADVLEAWASNVKLHFDAETDQQRFDRSQKFKLLMEQASQYRRKQVIHAVPVVTPGEH
jgi:hypothetical protein